jgi:hypothetical protein
MKTAAVGPMLLLRVDDNPLPCQRQGEKALKEVIAALGTAFLDIRWVIEVMNSHLTFAPEGKFSGGASLYGVYRQRSTGAYSKEKVYSREKASTPAYLLVPLAFDAARLESSSLKSPLRSYLSK